MRLKGEIALVTGGASGFGEGIARKFVEEGARVVLMDRDGPKLRAVAESLGEAAAPLEADVTQARGFLEAVALAQARFGGLSILVNNAGIGHAPRPMESLEEAEFDRIMAVNVRAVYLSARAAVPVFKAQGSGAILNIASTGGVSPRPNLTWYNASKGWMISATQAMAVELAPFGVRVNALNPVAGETPLLKTFMGEDTPEIRAKFLASIPIGRFSTPQDMGAAAAFLCSQEASMITGVALNVDGGRCI
ncbi:glucose 1-dehydrogenase [Neomegalonema perideroedes]|uniref:glucose 1-dehydrogenase n=1 Tax=Neomegalonema perideroedes TaxID=217219 RepID=UPI0003808DEE|nr:glucose 1-dehydrogenase [Neomegalonema perideroedes]